MSLRAGRLSVGVAISATGITSFMQQLAMTSEDVFRVPKIVPLTPTLSHGGEREGKEEIY